MEKSPEAFRTISEVAELLSTPAHVLRFWESRFTQIRPVKRAGGRRYYRPSDVALLAGIRTLLHDQGMTIRGVQKVLREQGVRHVCALGADQGLLAQAEGEWAEVEAVETTAISPPPPPGERVIAFPASRVPEAGAEDTGPDPATHAPSEVPAEASTEHNPPPPTPDGAVVQQGPAMAAEEGAEPLAPEAAATDADPPAGPSMPLFQFLSESWRDQPPEPDDQDLEPPSQAQAANEIDAASGPAGQPADASAEDDGEAGDASGTAASAEPSEGKAGTDRTDSRIEPAIRPPPDAAALAARLRRLSLPGVDTAPLVAVAARLRALRDRMQSARDGRS